MKSVHIVWYKTEKDGEFGMWGVYADLDLAFSAMKRIVDEGYGVEAKVYTEHVIDGSDKWNW